MPQPRNLPDAVLAEISRFAARMSYASSAEISTQGRGHANTVLGRWIIAGIVCEYYGATSTCASKIAGVTPTRATELVTLWRDKLSNGAHDQIFAAWEKTRRLEKLPTRKVLTTGWAA